MELWIPADQFHLESDAVTDTSWAVGSIIRRHKLNFILLRCAKVSAGMSLEWHTVSVSSWMHQFKVQVRFMTTMLIIRSKYYWQVNRIDLYAKLTACYSFMLHMWEWYHHVSKSQQESKNANLKTPFFFVIAPAKPLLSLTQQWLERVMK